METPAPARWAHAAMERAASAGVDRLLVQSEEDRDILLATRAAAAGKLVLVGNGIDLERFSAGRRDATRAALGLTSNDVLFLSAGRIVREKGFVELFEAYRRAAARNPSVRLAVAGPLDAEKSDVVDVAALDAARRAGALILGERDDMPDLYAAADAVVLVSWREGLPRVLMEGAAAGRPLIASDVRGCREVVRTPEMGLLVPPRDPAALAQAMLALAADPDLRGRLGARAREEAHARFDLTRVVARVLNVYDQLL